MARTGRAGGGGGGGGKGVSSGGGGFTREMARASRAKSSGPSAQVGMNTTWPLSAISGHTPNSSKAFWTAKPSPVRSTKRVGSRVAMSPVRAGKRCRSFAVCRAASS